VGKGKKAMSIEQDAREFLEETAPFMPVHNGAPRIIKGLLDKLTKHSCLDNPDVQAAFAVLSWARSMADCLCGGLPHEEACGWSGVEAALATPLGQEWLRRQEE
jgi:hypothetical protein